MIWMVACGPTVVDVGVAIPTHANDLPLIIYIVWTYKTKSPHTLCSRVIFNHWNSKECNVHALTWNSFLWTIKIDFKCMPILVEKTLPILIEGGKFWKNNANLKQHQHKNKKIN
jgi:hypothetical protein